MRDKIISLKDKTIIGNYYVNGFKGYLAVQEFNPELSRAVASNAFRDVMNKPQNKAYIAQRAKRLSIKTDIKNYHILRELINWLYADITELIGLTKEEIKELPGDIKRCIQSYKIVKRSYIDKVGQEHMVEIIDLKFIDKMSVAKMVGKHIGFFEEDNKQKQTKINLTKIDTVTLNNLFNAMIDKE